MDANTSMVMNTYCCAIQVFSERIGTKLGKIIESIEQYKVLLTELESITKEQKVPYHSLTSIGGDCFATAVVEQPETIYVDIYSGLLIEYSIEDAIEVVKRRIEQLNKYSI